MLKLLFPFVLLLIVCAPLAIAAAVVAGIGYGLIRLAAHESTETRRARQWYANV